jgi:hypothetical protein
MMKRARTWAMYLEPCERQREEPGSHQRVIGWEWAGATDHLTCNFVSEFARGWRTSKLGTCLGLKDLGKADITTIWPYVRTPCHPWVNSWIAWFLRAKYVQKKITYKPYCLLDLGSAASFIRYCLCSFVPILPPPPSPRLSHPPSRTTSAVALSASSVFTSVAKETRS